LKNYLDYMDTNGFWLRQTWDMEKGKMGKEGKMVLFPVHRRIFGKVLSFDENGDLPYETILYSATKKSAKTTIAASVGAWYLEEGPSGTEIYVIANSKEQGEGRVMRDIQFHFEKRIEEGIYSENPKKPNYIRVTQYRIERANGSFIQVLGQSFKSSAGSRHALTLWDELWGATTELDRRMWDEMTPIPTVNNSLRFISTYAGFENESDLLWEIYTRGVGKDEHESGQGKRVEGLEDLPCWETGNLFTYWTHDPTMPWQTEKYLNEQMESERPAAFLRLHLNQWVTSQEAFIPVEWFDHAANSYQGDITLWHDHPFREWPLVVGVDAGVKRDSTALVAVGYDAHRGKVGIAYHRIWTPTPDQQIDLEATVEKELLNLYNRFKVVSVVYDPTHLMQIMLRLKSKGLPAFEFPQTGDKMLSASQLLFDLFRNKNIEAYPDEVFRRHIQMAVAEATARGYRIKKGKTSSRHHVDGAVALAMAAHEAVSSGGVDISIPVVIRSPYSQTNVRPEDAVLPFPLRS
jgi:phage terminase large subunit-like protein